MNISNLKIRLSGLLKNKDFKVLFKNFTNFSFFQITNYLVPLITIPYIVHIIGAEKFGILSFAAAIIYYLQIFVDYGFNISGVQKLASERSFPEKIATTYSSILTIRVALSVIMMSLLLLSSLLFGEIKLYLWIYIFTFIMIPASTLQSVWFYNGMEKMQYLNYTNLVSRSIYLIGIFAFIHKSTDFLYVPLINSMSIMFAGIVSTIIIFKKFEIRYKAPSPDIMLEYLKDGWHLFISNLGMNLYRNSNVFILGLLAPKEIVGFYSAGEKIIKVLQMVFTPITNVFYPYISRLRPVNPARSLYMIKIVLLVMGGATFILSVILISMADRIVLGFFGTDFISSIIVIKIGAFVIFIGTLNYILGIIFMLNFSMKREFTKSVIRTGIANLILCFSLIYMFKEIGAAYSFLFAEGFLLFNLVIYIYQKQERWRIAGV